ncbi:MAG: hypothetical protein ACQEQO_06690 [Thermodesulfobacteriota bacterium]
MSIRITLFLAPLRLGARIRTPIYRGNAEGLRLVEPPARRGQKSPMDTLLKRPAREPWN